MGRRRVLHVLGVGLGTASGLSVLTGLAGCNKGGGQGGQGAGASAAAGGKGGACLDKGDIDEAAASLRKVLQYKDKTDTPEKKCSLCAQYEAGKYGSCGGCKLFAGGVQKDKLVISFVYGMIDHSASGGPEQDPNWEELTTMLAESAQGFNVVPGGDNVDLAHFTLKSGKKIDNPSFGEIGRAHV